MKISFSQHGEDLVILEHLLGLKLPTKGIYIDAGCFDPVVFSNTRLLNLHGWQGINIDAAQDVIQKFQDMRPDDHNVCAALGERKQKVILRGPKGAPSRSVEAINDQSSEGGKDLLETSTLNEILSSSPFRGAPVDFLDVDCEGHDLAVLKGFPFAEIRPKLIAVEGHSMEEAKTVVDFLEKLDYFKVCVRGPTHIFRAMATLSSELPAGTRICEL